jgi:AcrR family transcriptional regulator
MRLYPDRSSWPESDVDPRISRTRDVVLDATFEELAESGYDGMAVEAIARRAGVSKATVYRHWDGKEALVCDALLRSREAMVVPEEGSVRERITALFEQMARKYSEGVTTRCIPALVCASERHGSIREMYHDFVAQGRAHFAELIAEGVRTGELEPVHDLELAAGAIVGPVLVARFFTDTPFDPARAGEHVEWVLRGGDRSAAGVTSSADASAPA